MSTSENASLADRIDALGRGAVSLQPQEGPKQDSARVADPSGPAHRHRLALGHPAGLALIGDDKALLVSGLDPVKRTDVVYRVELADKSQKEFSAVIGEFTESAGLHKAKGSDVYAWADSRANATGTVYVLTK